MPQRKSMDLSAYRSKEKAPVLAEPSAETGAGQPKQIGRPKKPAAEKRNHKITLSFTKAEKDKISAMAGMVPEATFLMAKLREAGVLD